MEKEIAAVADFVSANRKALAAYLRQKLLAANASSYLDQLGKDGIEKLEQESAGVLVDLACALLRRLYPSREFVAEVVLAQLSAEMQRTIRLPRSEAYYAVLGQLRKTPTPP